MTCAVDDITLAAAEPTPATPAPLLAHFGISLGITTYQAGELIIARVHGEVVNTHFRLLDVPMGMAVRPDRIAIGVKGEIRRVPSGSARRW